MIAWRHWRTRLQRMFAARERWAWYNTARTLGQRFREDRLAVTAGGLTFTTLISVVPLVTVMLAIFSAFPMFSTLQGALQQYLLKSLIPEGISQAVLGALTQFSSRASRLGIVGLGALVASALAMMLTIDRALNAIWRVRQPRPIAQRVLVYWSAATLGPLLMGMSLTFTSYAISASRGLVDAIPHIFNLLLRTAEFFVVAGGVSALFHYVPNTHVRWRHAFAGGLFVAIGFAVARQLLALYLSRVPTYAVVYGAFATLPILLVWIYSSWIIVLLGAVVAAYSPALRKNIARWSENPGSRFHIALAVLNQLVKARVKGEHGITATHISDRLHIDPLQSMPVLDALVGLDWLGVLDEAGVPRYVLLCDPATTPIKPLLKALLLEPAPALRAFWQRADFDTITLQDALP